MAKMARVPMRMVHQQMREEVHRFEDRHELDSHQVLVCIQGLALVAGSAVIAKPG